MWRFSSEWQPTSKQKTSDASASLSIDYRLSGLDASRLI